MEFKDILAIAGKPGLFKLITQSKHGAVVESLLDGKRFTAFAHERLSTLEEISVFAETEDLSLKEVFRKMKEKLQDDKAIDPRSDKEELREFFEDMIPEHDKERVYPSDIKKILSWYNLLHDHDLLHLIEEEEKEETEKEKPEETEKNKESSRDQDHKEKEKPSDKKQV